jgi:rubrerythrin
MTRWICPVCGTRVITHIPVVTTPTCAHRDTPQHAKRTRHMNEEMNDGN